MKFTVTMECSKCGEKFVGQDEHLETAVGHMVKSAYDADHAGGPLNLELQALADKAEGVNAVSDVLGVLGLEIAPLTQEEYQEYIQKHEDGDAEAQD